MRQGRRHDCNIRHEVGKHEGGEVGSRWFMDDDMMLGVMPVGESPVLLQIY